MASAKEMAGKLAKVAAVVVALGGLALGVKFLQAPPEGPEPIAWDRESCAHCRMHIGEPRFAAQLQLDSGAVLDFDDPGCMLRYLADRHPAVRAAYVHHLHDDRWVELARAGFVEAGATPMGYGLGAVDASEPGALTLQEAQARIERGHLAQGGRP